MILEPLEDHNVRLQLLDTKTNKTLFRDIDKSNIEVLIHNEFVVGSEMETVEGLNYWIAERGNHQHDTRLELLGWEINK